MDEVTDEAIGAKLNILYTQKRAVSSELATAHACEKNIADKNKSLKHKALEHATLIPLQLLKSKGTKCIMDRMHPYISRFPSLHFYENKLLDGAQKAEKSDPFHDHRCLGPYMFFDIADGREHAGTSAAAQSLSNQLEAGAALEILSFLKNKYPTNFSCRKIGTITYGYVVEEFLRV
ncbi:hypothetical protein VPH35_085665 [Triticum aestivum]|nr:probable helicase MAGATAMA 3 isoform X2 [Triticum aestivum]